MKRNEYQRYLLDEIKKLLAQLSWLHEGRSKREELTQTILNNMMYLLANMVDEDEEEAEDQ